MNQQKPMVMKVAITSSDLMGFVRLLQGDHPYPLRGLAVRPLNIYVDWSRHADVTT